MLLQQGSEFQRARLDGQDSEPMNGTSTWTQARCHDHGAFATCSRLQMMLGCVLRFHAHAAEMSTIWDDIRRLAHGRRRLYEFRMSPSTKIHHVFHGSLAAVCLLRLCLKPHPLCIRLSWQQRHVRTSNHTISAPTANLVCTPHFPGVSLTYLSYVAFNFRPRRRP